MRIQTGKLLQSREEQSLPNVVQEKQKPTFQKGGIPSLAACLSFTFMPHCDFFISSLDSTFITGRE